MQRLREQRGLNYGDYAYIEHFQQQGGDAATAQTYRARHQQDFTIWLRPVQNENRLFALRAALYEFERSLKDEPFSADEVEQTKGFLDGYLLLYDQTDARKLGYALDDDFLGMQDFLRKWRAALPAVTADQVNAAWRKRMKPEELQCVVVGPGMAEAKKALLADAETPMHYQKDAQGNVPQKAAALLDADRAVNRTSFGAKGPGDVEVVPVDKMFE
jgi:zinc protease